MTVRSMITACLVGLTTTVLAGPANAQINGMGGVPGAAAAAGAGPSPATIGGGSPSAGMAGSATGGGPSGAGTNGVGNPGFANPGISPGNPTPGATIPGLMTAPGTNGTQPITGIPTPNFPAEVPGRVAPRDGGHPR